MRAGCGKIHKQTEMSHFHPIQRDPFDGISFMSDMSLAEEGCSRRSEGENHGRAAVA